MSPLLDHIYNLLTSVFSPHDTNTCLAFYTFKTNDEQPEEITKQVLIYEDPKTKQSYKLTLEKLEGYDIKYVQ